MSESEFERKQQQQQQQQHWCSYLYFMTDTLTIIFDDFGICLLSFRIEFSCLYIPQGHYCI